jgi:hypothetical protein
MRVSTFVTVMTSTVAPSIGRDFRCSHSTTALADGRPDDVRLSDIEHRFICQACGRRGADVRPHFGASSDGDGPSLMGTGLVRFISTGKARATMRISPYRHAPTHRLCSAGLMATGTGVCVLLGMGQANRDGHAYGARP